MCVFTSTPYVTGREYVLAHSGKRFSLSGGDATVTVHNVGFEYDAVNLDNSGMKNAWGEDAEIQLLCSIFDVCIVYLMVTPAQRFDAHLSRDVTRSLAWSRNPRGRHSGGDTVRRTTLHDDDNGPAKTQPAGWQQGRLVRRRRHIPHDAIFQRQVEGFRRVLCGSQVSNFFTEVDDASRKSINKMFKNADKAEVIFIPMHINFNHWVQWLSSYRDRTSVATLCWRGTTVTMPSIETSLSAS